MQKFKKYIKNSDKFCWGQNDVEHHSDSLHEFKLAKDAPGNLANPKENVGFSNDTNTEPQEGSAAHKDFHEHANSLSDDEHYAVREYKADSSSINGPLRKAIKQHKQLKKAKYKDDKLTAKKMVGDPPKESNFYNNSVVPHYGRYAEEHIPHLDKVTSHKTVEDHITFRGGIPGDEHRFPVGHEFTDHGYTGTSFQHYVAHDFSKTSTKHEPGKKSKPIIHVVHVPKGSMAHYLDVKGPDSAHSYHREKELLLHRGTRFKVTHHTESDTHHYIHIRVKKQGIRPKFDEGPRRQDGSDPKQGKFNFGKG
jgi:hypothetical protein